MSDDASSRPQTGGRRYRAEDPDVIEAAQRALDALNPSPVEREVAKRFAQIDEETAREIAQLLKSVK